MSPILVRPVREQLEHDRVIRLLQAKYKRKTEVAINPGNQQTMPVGPGESPWYPDLVLYGNDRNHKLLGVVEVETAESVNNLEAMSQWATFSRLKVPFHLYVPISYIDVAKRLCADLQITPPEIWTYQAIGEQIRFAMVQKGAIAELKYKPLPAAAAAKVAAKTAVPKPAVAKAAPEPVAAKAAPASTPAKPAAVKPPAKPVAAKPVAAKPVAAKPVAAKPVAAKPPAAKPAGKTAPVSAAAAAKAPAPARGRAAAPPARKPAVKPVKPAAKPAKASAGAAAKPAARKAPATTGAKKRR